MEILLALQPIAKTFMFITVAAGIISIIVVFACSVGVFDESDKEIVNRLNSAKDKGKKVLIASVISLLLILPVSRAWDIYKNVLIYRAINSDTTEHVINNTNKLLVKLEEIIDKVDAEEVVRKIKENTEEKVKEKIDETIDNHTDFSMLLEGSKEWKES